MVKFVSFERRKVPVRDVQITAIKKYVETGIEEILNEEAYTLGKRVRVTRGALKGLEGTLVGLLGKQRVKVEIDAIGQSVFLKIPMGGVEVVSG